jgi:hypothetical protein
MEPRSTAGRRPIVLPETVKQLLQEKSHQEFELLSYCQDERDCYYTRQRITYSIAGQIASQLRAQYPGSFRFFVVDAEKPFFRPQFWVAEEWRFINLQGREPEQKTAAKFVRQLGLKQDDLVIFSSGEKSTYQDQPCPHVVFFMQSDTHASAVPCPRDDRVIPSVMREVFFGSLGLDWWSLLSLYPGSSRYFELDDD